MKTLQNLEIYRYFLLLFSVKQCDIITLQYYNKNHRLKVVFINEKNEVVEIVDCKQHGEIQ